jgi:hypothetical protein
MPSTRPACFELLRCKRQVVTLPLAAMQSYSRSNARHALGRILVLNLLGLPLLGLLACNSGRKAPECKVLVGSLGELSERLEEVRFTVSAAEVKPAEVTEVLRPFSATAKKVAMVLNGTEPSLDSVKRITKAAAGASTALASQATQMADLAERMTDVEGPGRVVDERKQQVDKLELVIKEICEAEPSKCADISLLLARFPAPSDRSDVAEDAQAWTRKLNAWANELSEIEIKDVTLKGHVRDFVKNWRELAASMGQLVAALDVSKKYDALTKQFNEQLKIANQAIADANALCATKK